MYVLIAGADTVHNYQNILREIIYFNRKPAYYLNRAFKLTCSELNGRFVSNDYIQTLTVIHPKAADTQSRSQPSDTQSTAEHVTDHQQSPAHASSRQVHEHKVEAKEPKVKPAAGGFLDSGLIDAGDAFARTSTSK